MNIIKNLVSIPLLCPLMAFASDAAVDVLDLESLMDSDVQLTSVMRRIQSTRETGASVYVLSGKEILASGVTSIPQALTLVPGLQVRQIDNNLWAVTARATASRYSSKLLVMVDGQSIYDPIHAGVNWETLNVPLMDIEKIEVIRGQGSLLWGSNATNGVLNIITKHSEDTRNLAVQAATGSELDYDLTARYGSDIGTLGSYRIYALGRDVGKSDKSYRDLDPNDNSNSNGIGGRLDLNLSDDLFMLVKTQYQQMSFNSNVSYPDLVTNESLRLPSEDKKDAYSLMSRTEHILSDNASQMFQAAYAYDKSNSEYFQERRQTLDFDYQMNIQLGNYQFDWGANYRYIDLDIEETPYVSQLSDIQRIEQFGGFAQVQVDVIPNTLRFVVGNKSEHNDFTGWEHQPNAKLIWLVDEKSTIWTSISQGVRIPSVLEYNAVLRVGGMSVSSMMESIDPSLAGSLDPSVANYYIEQWVSGNQDIEAEKSISEEVGYRYINDGWNLDLALFHTETENVVAVESSLSPYSIEELAQAYFYTPAALPGYLASSSITNTFLSAGDLRSYGGELVVGKQITPDLKAEFGYSYTDQDYDLPESAISAIGFSTTLQQVMLKMSASLTESHSLFTMLRYEDGDGYSAEDFYSLDLSWRWQVTPQAQFGLTGNNLLHGEKLEFGNNNELYTQPTYVQPSVTANVMLNF